MALFTVSLVAGSLEGACTGQKQSRQAPGGYLT
jgi:hypothetical protein